MINHIITDQNYYTLNGIKVEFYFDEESNECILEMAEGHADTLFIPNTINGKPVTFIEFADWRAGGFDRVIVSENNSYFQTIDGVLFTADKKELLIYPPQKKDEVYVIPDGVEIIGEDTFCSNHYIKTLVFPKGFRLIVQYALACCKSLETVYLPQSLEKVLLKAFYFTEPMKHVYFDGSEQQWHTINFTDCNWSLTDAEIHFHHDYHKLKF